MTLKMDSINEIMRLCRLCLAKDEVNTPIFEEHGDIKQILLKISACLPVKVSKEDNLPKNICDGCSCKLEMLYHFWSTSANSEKKLIKLLDQIGVNKLSDNNELPMPSSLQSQQHSISSDPVVLKQEVVDVIDSQSVEEDLVHEDLIVSNDQDYLLEQEQIPYQPVEFQFQQDGFETVTAEDESTNVDTKPESESKPRKRRAAAMKALATMESEDEDDPDLIDTKIAKTEEQSDESAGEDPEPTTFVGLPSADDEQPGPSGVGKPSSDAPFVHLKKRKGRPQKLVSNDSPLEVVTIKVENESDSEARDLKFICHICKTDQKMSEKQLRVHFKESHKGKRLRSLKLHADNAVQCDICPKHFRSIKSLKEHMEFHSNQFTCDTCNAQFKKVIDYTLHLRLHSDEDLFKCILCNFVTDSINDITDHLNDDHDRFKCTKCDESFPVESWFLEHENFHSGEKPFECEYCGKCFFYTRFLVVHRNTVHKDECVRTAKVHECVVCKKHYQHRNSLKLHMNRHTGNLSVCDVCGRTLSNKEKLKFHMRTHTGYKPFSCSYCGKCFTKKPILVEHERIHTGEKPYSCEFCSRGFSQRSSLVIHMRGHTGERPYVCHMCNKGFVARAMLNNHFKTCKGYSY